MVRRTDRSAVVTGAARGIGRGIAELLVRRGYRVVVTDLADAEVRRTAEDIGAVAGLAQDVSVEASHHAVAQRALEHGPLAAWYKRWRRARRSPGLPVLR